MLKLLPLPLASILATAIVQIFLKNWMNKFSAAITILLISSYASVSKANDVPSWFVNLKQNDSQYLRGVAEGDTLEEATRYALADAAARLLVSISSESNMIREENQNSVNEEMRQNVRQNVEKIDFSNFAVTKSEKIAEKYFIEVEIDRSQFINEQKEKLGFVEKKLSNLEKNSATKNPLQKRNDLIKSLALGKELELRARILSGAGENINLKEKLSHLATLENELNKVTDKIEFFFDPSSAKDVTRIIRNALNQEKIAVANVRKSSDSGQIKIKISSSSKNEQIYGAYITKLAIDFENSIGDKTLASKTLEVTGSSSLNAKESQSAALKSLEEKIADDGILKTIGILN